MQILLKTLYLIGFVFFIVAQSGCSIDPFIPIEAKKYTINFTVDGEEFNISKEVKFYYRDGTWGSERGQSWMASDGLGEYIGYTSKNLLFIVSPFERTYGIHEYSFSPKILVSDNNGIEYEVFHNKSYLNSKHDLKITKQTMDVYDAGTTSYIAMNNRKKSTDEKRKKYSLYKSFWMKTFDKAYIDKNLNLKSLINAKNVPWLRKGESYDFTTPINLKKYQDAGRQWYSRDTLGGNSLGMYQYEEHQDKVQQLINFEGIWTNKQLGFDTIQLIKSDKEENYHFYINDINITARYIHHVLFYEPESESLIEIHSFGTNELSKW
ncbi:MAG TPA: hypothetical protein PLM93_10395 [Sulfuricurvum sp.]|nr:MAG: hypothetical protein B7Y30_07755 [Campylobacterales bacterium 16-40-21]OZA02426.1 MAG: hypothetical protein B7X89_09330 [Sulfuricurvum sp. 17-40-25]HQS67578.1 hypothetical protein [Sulfuricurvum sp.]HQT36707.1 hypothetical protein [Sulfuricurvum sp.]